MDVYNAYLYDNYVTRFDYILLYGEKVSIYCNVIVKKNYF